MSTILNILFSILYDVLFSGVWKGHDGSFSKRLDCQNDNNPGLHNETLKCSHYFTHAQTHTHKHAKLYTMGSTTSGNQGSFLHIFCGIQDGANVILAVPNGHASLSSLPLLIFSMLRLEHSLSFPWEVPYWSLVIFVMVSPAEARSWSLILKPLTARLLSLN